MPDKGTDKLKADAKQSLEKSMKWVGQSSFARQMMAGTASGWLTGAVLSHATKGVALIVGSGIILAQIGQHKGYLSSDWTTIKEAAKEKTHEVGTKMQNAPTLNKMKSFATKNRTFTAAFVGGFLMGMAC